MWPVPVAFIGANPCVTLLDDGTRTGFVSLWEAEWSVHGAGRAALERYVGHMEDLIRMMKGPDR